MRERIVLLDTYPDCVAAKEAAASAEAGGVFSVRFETPSMFVKRLWEVYGDGRRFIAPIERLTCLQLSFDELDSEIISVPGMLEFADSLVRRASGLPSFMDAADSAFRGTAIDASGVSEAEHAVLAACGRYYEVIRSLRLIEPGDAVLCLWEGGAAFSRDIEVRNDCDSPLPLVLEEVLESSDSISYICRPDDDAQIGRLPEGMRLGLAFPSGSYATGALVCDIIEGSECSDIVISSPDPLACFEQMRSTLVSHGMQACVSGSVSFQASEIGRVLLSLYDGLHDAKHGLDAVCPPTLKTALADAARSSYSDMGAAEALALDAALRSDRTLTSREALEMAFKSSDKLQGLYRLLSDPSDIEAMGALRAVALARYRTDALALGVEVASLDGMALCAEVAHAYDASRMLPLKALARAEVLVSIESVPEEGEAVGRVHVMSLGNAAHAQASSCDMLIALGLDSSSYQVVEKKDAGTTLLLKLGVVDVSDAIAIARRQFKRLVRVPRTKLVLSRPLFDADAIPTYPCAMFEEFVDAYRADVTDASEIDNPYALPKALLDMVVERGEEALYSNALSDSAASQAGSMVAASPALAASPVSTVNGKPILTPSSIETYLSCPYRWLMERSTSSIRVDEQFSPLEMGSYKHAVLEQYHRFEIEQGGFHSKGQRDHAMAQAISNVRDMQRSLDPNSGRLVACTETEEREIDAIDKAMRTWPDFDGGLLPGFAPKHLEYEISPSDGIEYAGCIVCGRIDRVDVDDAGHAVVVDFKGHLDASYAVSMGETLEFNKVQALIYAAALKEKLGIEPVGALYASYNESHEVYGAYDESCVTLFGGGEHRSKATSLPHCGELSFEALLESCEAYVASGIGRLLAGDFAPNPSFKGACDFCPVDGCERRLS